MGRPVIKWQILAQNPDKLAEFYTNLFDWTINSNNPLNYRMVDTGSKRGINGGIWPVPPEGYSFVQLFVEVDDVGMHVEKATRLGGKTVIPPQKLPDGDEMAVINDPEGIPVALIKPA